MSDHASLDVNAAILRDTLHGNPLAVAALDALVAERDRWRAVACNVKDGTQAAEAEVARLREALRYMADYQMTGSERTLHIDFQGIARAALAAPDTKETR